jgi:hypothetical protein
MTTEAAPLRAHDAARWSGIPIDQVYAASLGVRIVTRNLQLTKAA